MKYDLVVIGAGPAGLMASTTAAKKGLRVLLVELKKKIPENLRMCASVLYIQPGFHGDTEYLEDDKIVFTQNDFSVRYDGGYQPIHEWCYVSPAGHRFRMGKEHFPAAVALDKAVLLQHLVEDALDSGVELWDESAALKVENTVDGARVLIKKRYATPQWYEAKKCIVSDGVCSRITKVSFPEVWANRLHLTPASGVGFLVEQLDCPWGDDVFALVKNRFGSAYFLPTPMRGSDKDKIVWKVMGLNTDPIKRQELAHQCLDALMKEEPFAPFFANAKILGRLGCAWDIYTPIYKSDVENTLLVGDVCAMQEVDIQGALTCGFRAGNAVAEELDGEDGFDDYTKWWNEAFEFNASDDPARDLAQGFGLFALGAEVLDYWFSVMEKEKLNAFMDHNRLGSLLKAGFMKNRKEMEKERPDIVGILDNYFSISAEKAYGQK